jgi:DNA-3-methyladenine glycosylase
LSRGLGGGRPPPGRPFPRDVLAGDTLAAARALLGARLVRDPSAEPDDSLDGGERRVGRIVEVEAYIGEADRASHARMGPTPRNRVMFGPPGVAYVYLVYGMHHCLNVVTEPAPRPAAVLIRAVEPLTGIAAIRRARERGRHAQVRVPDARLAAGPGLVGAAFGLDRSHTGLDLCDPRSPVRLEAAPPGEAPPVVVATPRIGIAYAGEPWIGMPWRLVVAGSPSLSTRHGRVRAARRD